MDLGTVDSDGDPITAPACDPLDPLGPAAATPRLKPTEPAALALVESMAGTKGEVDGTTWRAAALDARDTCAVENRDSRRRVVAAAFTGLVRAGVVEAAMGVIRSTRISTLAGIFNDVTDDWSDDHGPDCHPTIRSDPRPGLRVQLKLEW